MAYKIDRWIVHDDYDVFGEYLIQQMLSVLDMAQEAAYRAAKDESIPLPDRLRAVGGAVRMLDSLLAREALSNVTSDETGRTPVREARDHTEALLMRLQMEMIESAAESGQPDPT